MNGSRAVSVEFTVRRTRWKQRKIYIPANNKNIDRTNIPFDSFYISFPPIFLFFLFFFLFPSILRIVFAFSFFSFFSFFSCSYFFGDCCCFSFFFFLSLCLFLFILNDLSPALFRRTVGVSASVEK